MLIDYIAHDPSAQVAFFAAVTVCYIATLVYLRARSG